jgi:hypothetical protein
VACRDAVALGGYKCCDLSASSVALTRPSGPAESTGTTDPTGPTGPTAPNGRRWQREML